MGKRAAIGKPPPCIKALKVPARAASGKWSRATNSSKEKQPPRPMPIIIAHKYGAISGTKVKARKPTHWQARASHTHIRRSLFLAAKVGKPNAAIACATDKTATRLPLDCADQPRSW